MRDPVRIVRPLIFAAAVLPLLLLLYQAHQGDLGVNPVETLHHTLGNWTLRLLLVTLFITPLRLIPGWNWLTRLRRMTGLFAFFYASLHLAVYIGIDQEFDWGAIWADISKRPYITLGISAYLLLLPLAATSSQAMMRRLGSSWTKLHKLIYLITALGILHFYLLVKADVSEPAVYAALFLILLVLRFLLNGRKVRKSA